MLERLSRGAGLSFRPIEMRRFEQELQTIVDIFNDAWSDNWGFVPMTPAEVRYMGKNLKPIVRAEHAWIGAVDGEPAAMTVTLPNVNEAIADLGGRLLPFGWAKLLWRLKVRGTRSARMPLMGVRKKYQGTPKGAALALGVIEAVRSWHAAHGAKEAELSWVLEDNRPTHDIIELVGGRPLQDLSGLREVAGVSAAATAPALHGAGPGGQPRRGRPGRPAVRRARTSAWRRSAAARCWRAWSRRSPRARRSGGSSSRWPSRRSSRMCRQRRAASP